MRTIEIAGGIMAKIKVNGQEFDAADGPFGVKIWPPEAAGAISAAIQRRAAATVIAIEAATNTASRGGKSAVRNGNAGRRRKRTGKEIKEIWRLGGTWDLPKRGEG